MLDCDILVSKFELQLRYDVHFQINTLVKGINLSILLEISWIVSLLLICIDNLGIEYAIKQRNQT